MSYLMLVPEDKTPTNKYLYGMSLSSKILITIQFFCLGLLLFRFEMPPLGLLLFIQILGLGLALWSVVIMKIGRFNIQPEVKVGSFLIKKGPYKLIRNPMYAGLILFFGSGIWIDFDWQKALVFFILCFVLVVKIFNEEKFLEQHFGSSYINYKRDTFRLIPYIF